MNILKPELIWVEGRCYRFLENREWKSSHNVSPYIEDSDQFDDTDDDEYCNEIGIEPYKATKFKHTFHVAKPFFPFIVGSRNAVRTRLETETKTVIQLPKVGEDGDITIIGHDSKSIKAARRRIDLLIESTRRRLRFTHFLSIPLNDNNITMKFTEFKADVLTNLTQTCRAVDENIFQSPNKLHLTIGMLTLLDNAERNQAIEALNYCKEHIVKQIVQKCDPIHIRLQGVDIMNDDPSSAKVLYAKIAPNEALQKIVDEIMNYFAEIGLLRKEKDSVKLHVTLMNVKFLKKIETDTETAKTFDVTEILKAHENTFFGETTLKEILISQLHTGGSDSYYQTTGKISLSEETCK